MESLYQNIGEKIKSMAKAVFVLGTLASIIMGIIIIGEEVFEYDAAFGVIMLIVGPIIAWVSSWITYGFGELIEKASSIDRKMNSNGNAKSETQTKIDNERIVKLERLRSQGLITEEEYQTALSKK